MDTSLSLDVDTFWISPYALSAFVALHEKGLAFTTREIHLEQREQQSAEFMAKSLTGRVPVLRHGEYTLAESQAIGEYLAETFPAPDYPRLFPADLKERGTSRMLMAWIRSDLMPIREERSTATMFYERANKPLSDKGRAAADRVLRVAEKLVGDGRKNLFHDWCLADTDFGFFLMRLVLNGDPVPAKVRAYAEGQWARPAVRKWVDRKRAPYVAY
jgi:glutathione S-transferase